MENGTTHATIVLLNRAPSVAALQSYPITFLFFIFLKKKNCSYYHIQKHQYFVTLYRSAFDGLTVQKALV